MDLRDKRDLNNGFGDAMARAVELVVTPGIFGFLGWLLDRKLGTTPLFALIFFIGVFGYVVWKLWMGYETAMQKHERGLGVQKATERVD
jgi:F0F1-type ATP synthase assembly protein I